MVRCVAHKCWSAAPRGRARADWRPSGSWPHQPACRLRLPPPHISTGRECGSQRTGEPPVQPHLRQMTGDEPMSKSRERGWRQWQGTGPARARSTARPRMAGWPGRWRAGQGATARRPRGGECRCLSTWGPGSVIRLHVRVTQAPEAGGPPMVAAPSISAPGCRNQRRRVACQRRSTIGMPYSPPPGWCWRLQLPGDPDLGRVEPEALTGRLVEPAGVAR
jgi:hypothetical protein